MIIKQRLHDAIGKKSREQAVESQGVWVSWAELAVSIERIVQCLDEASIPVGGRVGILFRNRISALAAFLACIVSDRCTVAFNPLLPGRQLAADIEKQFPLAVIGVQSDLSDANMAVLADANLLPFLQLSDSFADEPNWIRIPSPPPLESPLLPDVLVEMLTSGTTGLPKRIPLTRASMDESFVHAEDHRSSRSTSTPPAARILIAPMAQISGIHTALTTLAEGRRLVLLEKFTVEDWVSAVERHSARVANLPPAALRMILDANIPRERLSSLLTLLSGSAPLDPSVIDAFLERYDLPVLPQYGATEFAGSVAGWTLPAFKALYPSKRGSAGQIQSNIEARIVDPEDGSILAPGEVGVLELRGQQLGDTHRWTRTTDRAALDSDNYLWIHGRADNAINRGGFKIQPDDIARAIEEHSGVKEAVVVGIKDTRLGEVPVAAIVLNAGSKNTQSGDLRDFLAERLLPYQIPTAFLTLSEIPRTPSMKPNLQAIKALF